jgi:hypothetical protein
LNSHAEDGKRDLPFVVILENYGGQQTTINIVGGSPWDKCITNCTTTPFGARSIASQSSRQRLKRYCIRRLRIKQSDSVVSFTASTELKITFMRRLQFLPLISDIIGKLKGGGSYFLNKELQITKDFHWQDGFGVLSFAEKQLPKILRYIEHQKEHHRNNTINDVMEKTDQDELQDHSRVIVNDDPDQTNRPEGR